MKPRARRARAVLRKRIYTNRVRRIAAWLMTADDWEVVRRIAQFRATLREDLRELYEEELLLRIFLNALPEPEQDRTPAGK